MPMMFFPNLDPVNKDQSFSECTLKSELIRNYIDEVIGFAYTFQYADGHWYMKVCDLNNHVQYYKDSYNRMIVKDA